jgi:flagellar basal-body rod protein FlgG
MWSMFRVATSGAHAQQRALDVAANNLANAQTTGFKAQRADIADLPPGEGIFTVAGLQGGVTLELGQVGQGAAVAATRPDYTPGPALQTGRQLDVAIAGEGFIPVLTADGLAAYTRDGSLRVDGQGRLATASGALVAPGFQLPPGASDVAIDANGRITARLGDLRQELGTLQLVRFVNSDGMVPLGGNLMGASAAAGDAIVGRPGTEGLGSLAPASLEGSNVDTANELVRVLQAQRAYQANLRALRTIDEMIQEANNMRRS